MSDTTEANEGKSGSWGSETGSFVQDWQERAYRNLAVALHLGSDPTKAYDYLSSPPMPFEHVSIERFIQAGDNSANLDQEQLEELSRTLEDRYQHYFSLKMPTPYEDPNRYPIMWMTFDALQNRLLKKGRNVKPKPLLATLPSGDVNAKISIEPKTKTPIIFFERGLFHYFHDFALLTGWGLPPLSVEQLYDPSALAQLPRMYQIPFQAPKFFTDMLYTYIVDGTPLANRSPIPPPRHNLKFIVYLLMQMEWFVMAHELAHIEQKHFNEDARKDHEYAADAGGFTSMVEVARDNSGNVAVSFWACDLALTAINMLYRAIGILEFGDRKLSWISETHPDPLSRRNRLRETIGQHDSVVSRAELSMISQFCGIADDVHQKLWEISAPLLLLAHERGARPSPIWKDQIEYCFKLSN